MNTVPSPTSRSGKRIHLSFWDVFWALTSPIIALYLRDALIIYPPDRSAIALYWCISAAFALLAFFSFRLQDGFNRNFSVQEAIDIVEAILFAMLLTCALLFTITRLNGIPRSTPLIHGVRWAGWFGAASAQETGLEI